MRRYGTLAIVFSLAYLVPGTSSSSAAPTPLPPPVASGVLHIAGQPRDGSAVTAAGLTWHVPALPAGDRLLSFQVGYAWSACQAPGSGCRTAADSTATPFAARRYVAGHADTGRYLQVTVTASETIETDPATFTFHVVRASATATAAAPVASYGAGRAPQSAFVNGLPEARTGSDRENFALSPPHYDSADGRPTLTYRVDRGPWTALPAAGWFSTGTLRPGRHSVAVRTANTAGTSVRSFHWRVEPLPRPVACIPRHGRRCWYPPHLDRTGRPMRWDWQIGRVTPLQRVGTRAVDLYDIDGFLTTKAEIRTLHTTWQAATLAHPKVACYLDLAWEDYRPDASPIFRGGAFPVDTLGKVYFGFPQERWLDVRQLNALKPMIDHRIAMCAAKGFDSVELDDIDSFDPPGTTGFHLTPGDWQNFLAYTDNRIHEAGMTALWKNSPLLSWWGRRYTDGAVVEECYAFPPCFSAGLAGSTQYGFTCTGLDGPRPCGWDDFTADHTRRQPTGKWVGEVEYAEDGVVCAPGASCTGRHRYSAYCRAVGGGPNGFSAMRMDENLDGRIFQPCPTGK